METRKIQETSRKAFNKPQNAETRESHKDIILKFLNKYPSDVHTVREIATHTHLGYRPTQKRVSDLYAEGRIKINGTIKEMDNDVSQYQFVSWEIQKQKSLSRHEILKQFLRQNHPQVYLQAKEIVEQQYKKLRLG